MTNPSRRTLVNHAVPPDIDGPWPALAKWFVADAVARMRGLPLDIDLSKTPLDDRDIRRGLLTSTFFFVAVTVVAIYMLTKTDYALAVIFGAWSLACGGQIYAVFSRDIPARMVLRASLAKNVGKADTARSKATIPDTMAEYIEQSIKMFVRSN